MTAAVAHGWRDRALALALVAHRWVDCSRARNSVRNRKSNSDVYARKGMSEGVTSIETVERRRSQIKCSGIPNPCKAGGQAKCQFLCHLMGML